MTVMQRLKHQTGILVNQILSQNFFCVVSYEVADQSWAVLQFFMAY